VVREEFLTGGSKRFLLSLSLSLFYRAQREVFAGFSSDLFLPQKKLMCFSILSEFRVAGSLRGSFFAFDRSTQTREQTRSYFSLSSLLSSHAPRNDRRYTAGEKRAERAFLKIKSHVFVPPRREKSADKCIFFLLLREKR
jgi:hypothetical protein